MGSNTTPLLKLLCPQNRGKKKYTCARSKWLGIASCELSLQRISSWISAGLVANYVLQRFALATTHFEAIRAFSYFGR